MPTYDYACRACSHAFEHFQSISDKLLRTCPRCRARRLERLMGTGIGIVFKGSGFYETDYKRTAKERTEDPGATRETPADAPPAGQADARPASPAASPPAARRTATGKAAADVQPAGPDPERPGNAVSGDGDPRGGARRADRKRSRPRRD